MSIELSLPRPVVNADSQAYWDGAREGRLLIRKCRACGVLHFMPRYLCPACWSEDLEWVQATGRGQVYSYTVIRRAPSAPFIGRVPYVVAMVELEEGPRMVANVVGEDALAVQIGDRVEVRFEDRGEGAMVPQFARTMGAGDPA